jgi:hypothetical protein
MWRAVRAGFIVRAQRAIQDGDRPFKRDVRWHEHGDALAFLD